MKIGGIISLTQILYNPDYAATLSEEGKLICLLHEYIHATLAYEGKSHEDHYVLMNDPDWIQGIKEIFPGQSSNFYDQMKYAGCIEIYGSFPNRNEIISFLDSLLKE